MKTNKNVKGFTLVELIVVIAIIGVLAAILVPSMLGYVKKANQSAVNSNAKTVFNAAATAVTDCDTKGVAPCASNKYSGKIGVTPATCATTGSDDFTEFFKNAIGAGTLGGLTTIEIGVKDGAVSGVGVVKSNYKGSYPTAINKSTGSYTIDDEGNYTATAE